jgi:hypothetical protein
MRVPATVWKPADMALRYVVIRKARSTPISNESLGT